MTPDPMEALIAMAKAIEAVSDGGSKGWQCVSCGEWDELHQPDCLVAIVRALSATLTADRRAREAGWKPVETAPKDGTEILVGAYYNSGKWWMRGFGVFVPPSHGQGGYWRSSQGITEPTHWQPLPAPPERQEP